MTTPTKTSIFILALCAIIMAVAAPALSPVAAVSSHAPSVSPSEVIELRGDTAVRALESAGMTEDTAERAGLEPDEVLAELRNDDTAFVGASGEFGYVEPTLDDEHYEQHLDDDHGDIAASSSAAPSSAQASPFITSALASTDAFALHSRPSSTKKVFLDFDGHTTTNTYWNSSYTGNQPIVSGAYNPEGSASTFSTLERQRIAEIWAQVAEDFAPFDVDVTTADPGTEALRVTSSTDDNFGARVVITSTDWYFDFRGGRAGGIAYLNSVTWSTDTPSFVFAGNLASGAAKPTAEAAAHEAGHAMSLSHDGVAGGTGYYAGHGDWAPIMGVGYSRLVTQWSRGEYLSPDNTENDVNLIAERLGIAGDDHGNSRTVATPLAASATVVGVLGQSDVDAFSVSMGAGALSVTLRPAAANSNLMARAQVRDQSGTVRATASPSSSSGWTAATTVALPEGTYTVEVVPVGHLTPTTGFSTYGSMGSYDLTISAPAATPTTPTTPPPTTVTPTTPPTTVAPPTTTPPAAAGGVALTPITPTRILDTRDGFGGSTRLGASRALTLQVTGRAGVPSSATAVSLNVTGVDPSDPGFLTTYPCSSTVPNVSTLNYNARTNVANGTIATLDPAGRICIFSHSAADVVVDVTGWLGPTGSSRLTTVGPSRAADTRSGFGGSRRLAAGQTISIDLTAHVGAGATAAAVNVTAVLPSDYGFITTYPCGATRPNTSSLNYVPGDVRANNAIVALGAGETLCVFSHAATDIVVDVTGRFAGSGLGYVPTSPVRLVDTRSSSPIADRSAISFSPVLASTPANVAAASVNFAAVGHTADGYLTSYDCGVRPNSSALNQRVGMVVANGAIAPLDGSGRSCAWTLSGGHLVVDLLGWWVR